MSAEKLRVGIIGMGFFAANSHVPDLRGTGRAEVVAAARRSTDRLAMAKCELEIPATYTDWREMLAQERLDAVVVSTPHDQHVEPTVAALERGLHVLLEKPLATSVADAQTILRAAQRSDRVVMMGVNRRGDPGWRTAQRLLAAGDIGRLRQITAVMCGDLRVFREVGPLAPGLQQWLDSMSEMHRTYALDLMPPGSWRQDVQQMGGDMLADTGAHTVDLLFWLAGASAVEVMAYSPTDRPPQAAIITLQAPLSNGVIVSLTFNDHVAMGDDLNFRGSGQLAVFGDKGKLTAKVSMGGGGGPEELVIERNGDRQPVVVEGETISPSAAFVAAILDGAPNVATVDDAARVVAFTQGAYQSAAERRIVRLDEDL